MPRLIEGGGPNYGYKLGHLKVGGNRGWMIRAGPRQDWSLCVIGAQLTGPLAVAAVKASIWGIASR